MIVAGISFDNICHLAKALYHTDLQKGCWHLAVHNKDSKLLEIYSLSPRASGSTCPEGAISSLNTSLKNVTDTKIIVKE